MPLDLQKEKRKPGLVSDSSVALLQGIKEILYPEDGLNLRPPNCKLDALPLSQQSVWSIINRSCDNLPHSPIS